MNSQTHWLAIGLGLALFAAPSLLLAQEPDCNPGYREAIVTEPETGPETTPLPPELLPDYRAWLRFNCVSQQDIDLGDYDYQGAFLAGISLDEQGMFPDTFMRHNHILFSTESQYSYGPCDGCSWLVLDGQEECVWPDSECSPANYCGE